MHAGLRAAGQVPKEKCINISEKQLARGCHFPSARNILQQPTQFQAAEISAQRQSRLWPEPVLTAVAGETRDIFRYPRVLPNDGIRNRFARFALPEDGSLPLIGDADRGQIRSTQSAQLQRFSNHFFRAPQDFQWIVLHPARPRENLFVLFLRYGNNARGLVKDHESRAGRTLVNCSNVVFQWIGPLCQRRSILRNCRLTLQAKGWRGH